MRAQFIRGKDPKDAMEIGLAGKYGGKNLSLFKDIHKAAIELKPKFQWKDIKVSDIEWNVRQPVFTIEISFNEYSNGIKPRNREYSIRILDDSVNIQFGDPIERVIVDYDIKTVEHFLQILKHNSDMP